MRLRYYPRQLFLDYHHINYNQFMYINIINGNDFLHPVSLAGFMELNNPDGQTFEDSIEYVKAVPCSTKDEIVEDYARITMNPSMNDIKAKIDAAFRKYDLSIVPDYPFNIFPNIRNSMELETKVGFDKS